MNGHAAIGQKLSRAESIRQARAAKLHELPLLATGGTALVRRLTLPELIALDAIPSHLQAMVSEMVEPLLGGEAVTAPSNSEIISRLGGPLAAIKLQGELADAAALLGFVDPQLVLTADQITDPDKHVLLSDIDFADRAAYWAWCQGQEAAEAAAVEAVFPVPTADVDVSPPGQDVSRHAEPLAEPTAE